MLGAMKVQLRDPADLGCLRGLVRSERDARQRDRYRVVLLACEGLQGREATREQIATATGRSRQFVDEWVKRYRDGGVASLRAKKQPGAAPRLTADEREQLKQALDAGPQDGVDQRCVFFGQDIRALIERRFKKTYSLSGVYKLLHGLGYSWLCPRPRHPNGDPQQQEAFKKRSSRTWKPSRRPIPISVC